jgi:UDP-N-acetylmuramoylalanine--D-glutamate ligase
MNDWSGKRVVIIGAARQGLALARYLIRQGAHVTLNDRRSLPELAEARQAVADLPEDHLIWVVGGHPLELLDQADWVCPSGGVALDLPLMAEAVRRGIPLSNDSQIFLEAAPCPVIGVTGSAGKTTTTTLVGRMAAAANPRTWVGGNIGSPLIGMIEQMLPGDLAVMELSSFQLEIMTRSPQTAAVLNITPNHLDRHGSMEVYTAAKAHILRHQSPADTAVLGRDDPGAWGLRDVVQGRLVSFGLGDLPPGESGTLLEENRLILRTPQGSQVLMERERILLRGEHNLLNTLAACTISAAAGMPVQAMQTGVDNFRGVAHRLEFVRRWGGADWYNDSIATAPERAMAAIRSFSEPLMLLAGGRDKNLPWEAFADLANQRVDRLILFGEAAEKIEAAMQAAGPNPNRQTTIYRCDGLREAVRQAARIVQPGDVVLLSPGGTSFDEFKDFEERGRCFVQWVKDLK